jgi:Mrp family chromosome partitioning ATPase
LTGVLHSGAIFGKLEKEQFLKEQYTMSEACTHDCSSCKSNCDHRAPQHEPPHARSRIQKVIGVVSGKGGVGKSMTSAMLAVSMRRLGFKAGVLDADITGPSIPRLFGVKGPAIGDGESINPVSSRTGVEIMSINLLLDDPEAPVVWRGPVIAGAVKQFWQEVVWDVDFLFVDMPPGTGDVPLTVFQTLPVDGIVIVSSPQELVGMIVGKAVQMAQMMHVPILGLVENMSYAVCPDCGKHINVFGDSHVDEIADKYKLPVLAKMPIDPELAKEADAGMIEMFAGDYLDNAAQTVAKLLKK